MTAPARAQGYGYTVEDEESVILPPRAVIFRLGRAGFTGMTTHASTARPPGRSRQPLGNRVQLVVDGPHRPHPRSRASGSTVDSPGTVPGGRRPGYGWTRPRRARPGRGTTHSASRPPRDNNWRDRGTYAPVPLSRAEPLPPVDRRPEERRVATRPLPPQDIQAVPPAEAPARARRGPPAQPDGPQSRQPGGPLRRGAAPGECPPEGAKHEAPRKTAARTKPSETIETPAALVPPLAPQLPPSRTPSRPARPPRRPRPRRPNRRRPRMAAGRPRPTATAPCGVIGGITPGPGKDEPAKGLSRVIRRS